MLSLVLATSVGASRVAVQVHEADQTKFGATCDDLQNTFSSRLVGFQGFLDANPDLDSVSRATEARAMVKAFGIIRTLRRARTCSWVVDNDSEELEGARSIVQALLSRNPCADVARAELEAGASAETGEIQTESLQRSMQILSSDTCEAPDAPPQGAHLAEDDLPVLDAQLANAEDDLQDQIEELEDSASASFVQTKDGTGRGLVGGFFRSIGIALMMIFLLLACVGSIAIITAFILGILGHLSWRMGLVGCGGVRCDMVLSIIWASFLGGAGAGAVGIAGCSYQLYTQLLPRLSQ